MKNKIKYVCLLIATLFIFSCSEDKMSSVSVIVDPNIEKNEFDHWITNRYVNVYNIDLKYRFEDIESDMNYNLVPADYDLSIIMGNMVKYLCLEAYDEVTGSPAFIRGNFPKIVALIGSPSYRNNGTMVLGTAEGGQKITLYNINLMDLTDMAQLNEWYFQTIHHEFAHILHQKKPYSVDFKEISSADYVTDSWKDKSDEQALQEGFISPYAASAVDEDFVELIATYLVSSPEAWENMFTVAGDTGRPILEAKFNIVQNYLRDSWDIDIHQLRSIIAVRMANMDEQDFTSLN